MIEYTTPTAIDQVPETTLTSSLGNPTHLWDNIYVGSVISPGSGSFVHISGDTMTGDLIMTSGLSVVMGPIKIGSNATASNINSIAIGSNATSNAISSVAVGNNDSALANFSTAIGYNNTSNGNQSVTIGFQNFASSAGSMAIGINNNALATDTVVIGNTVNGTLGGVLYLGAPSGVMIQTGKNLLPEASGTQNLGSPALPWANIYGNKATTVKSISFSNSPYTALSADESLMVDTSGGQVLVILPSGITGKNYQIKKMTSDANFVVVSGSQTIDGATTKEIKFQYSNMAILSNSNWSII